jgi:hypothetical protein
MNQSKAKEMATDIMCVKGNREYECKKCDDNRCALSRCLDVAISQTKEDIRDMIHNWKTRKILKEILLQEFDKKFGAKK